MELRIVPVIQFITIVAAFKLGAVSCVPMMYEIGGYRNSIDLDTEQTEARYDQGMLSDIMNDERASEMQKAESCVADNFKYDHGQKIQRYDPCEICLCIDGEIFCWWKQCDIPSNSEFHDRSLGASGDVQLVTPSAHPATVGPSSTTATLADPMRPTTISSDVSNAAISSPQPTSTAVPSHPAQPDFSQSVRIVHPQSPPDNIPQNILSFPQSPPIMMMYRPALGAGGVGKNTSTSAGVAAATERNKHGGPLKKATPLHLAANGASGKKPYRKSKSKGYAINYGRIEGGLEEGRGGTRVLAVTERMPPSDGMRILNDENRSFLLGGMGGERSEEDGSDDDDDEDSDDDDDNDDDGDGVDEEDDESEQARRQSGNAKADANGGDGFGGYGYGMIREPEDDKQQHYIITSSGHVEMFDDNSMEATENAFGMNRLLSAQQTLGSSTTVQPMALVFGGTLDDSPNQTATSSSIRREDYNKLASNSSLGEPIAPLIVMTTNVTQHSNYSVRFTSNAGGSPPLQPYAPLSPAAQQPSRSVIDVLNSTTVDSDDYQDDNQTELIYPAVPGIRSSSSGSRSTDSVPDADDGGGQQMPVTTTASSVTAGVKSTPEQHCVVMGVSYKVGAVLKQETGNCLHCVCVQGPESDPVPRVTCTPLNCPPLILPDILDGAGF
ncbi:uncharacterized protein LOC134209017 [Armigeres subalbatus]|uniref:uncharacterized protein LOC134209017 n=1 Tax=Armigeres subalbatus TaxID=124917 RepID=UPI002ED23D3E